MTLTIHEWIQRIPKVELHVHLEGSVQPHTLLDLARRHNVALPADDVPGLREWYRFRDFDHFIEIYHEISACLRSAEDIELISRQFLEGQAAQNIRYSEVTFTPHNQYRINHLGFHEQLDAVNRARAWGERELGVRMGMIVDIPREIPAEDADVVGDWVIEGFGNGIIALGLGGPEVGHPPENYQRVFDRVRSKGISCILHAGETAGPESVWSALKVASSFRIGHGVRSIEDPKLINHLRDQQIPLDVCPTSNLCLKVYSSYAEHCLPELLRSGIYVTLNSDDPPMFNTSLTNEFQIGVREWGWDKTMIRKLVFNAVDASLLSATEQAAMRSTFEMDFAKLD